MSDFPPIAMLVPHREPMVLLDRVVAWSPGHVECAMRVRSDTRFVDDGILPTPFMIEHMAQSVAVCLGYEAYMGGRGVRVGMIVSCRAFRAHSESASAGDDLMVHANKERGNETLSHFHCEVRSEDEVLADATLTLFHGETLFDDPS
jgi:predicted hotdog family 3-hydroxylacyl-ACP dehydratase